MTQVIALCSTLSHLCGQPAVLANQNLRPRLARRGLFKALGAGRWIACTARCTQPCINMTQLFSGQNSYLLLYLHQHPSVQMQNVTRSHMSILQHTLPKQTATIHKWRPQSRPQTELDDGLRCMPLVAAVLLRLQLHQESVVLDKC